MSKSTFSVNLLALLIILTLSASNAHGQSDPIFGFKGGINIATLAQSDIDGYEYKPGVMIGAFASIKIPESQISFQPEVLYTQYGAGIEDTDTQLNLNYLQIPLLAKVSLDESGAGPIILVGPYANFLLKSEAEGDDISVDLDELTKGSTFGAIIGAGYENQSIILGVQFSTDLTTVFEDDFDDGEKNFGISLSVGIKL